MKQQEVINGLLSTQLELEAQLRASQECVRRITQRNNELRGKVLRLIREKEILTQTLDDQVHKIITMEYKLDKIKEVLHEQ